MRLIIFKICSLSIVNCIQFDFGGRMKGADTFYLNIIKNNNIDLLKLVNSLNQDYCNIEVLYDLPLYNE